MPSQVLGSTTPAPVPVLKVQMDSVDGPHGPVDRRDIYKAGAIKPHLHETTAYICKCIRDRFLKADKALNGLLCRRSICSARMERTVNARVDHSGRSAWDICAVMAVRHK